MPHTMIASSRVEGTPVFNTQGERLGKVDDLMIDKASGKTAYALMAYDGFLGAGERYYPLPWSTLDYDENKHGFIVPVTREQMDGAHFVDNKEVEDEIQWREAVHAYFGATPYWGIGPAY